MIDVSTEIDINAQEIKWQRILQILTTLQKWYVNIKAAKWRTPRPLKVGSQIVLLTPFSFAIRKANNKDLQRLKHIIEKECAPGT